MTVNSFLPIWLMAIICVVIIAMKRKGTWAFIRQVIIAVLLFAINLRIVVPSEDVEKEVQNLDILFVVDTTISMVAEDYDGDTPRLEGVKNDIKEIIDAFPGARYSLLTFDNRAVRQLPYTQYNDSVIRAIDTMHTQTQYYAKGSNLNTPLTEMEIALQRNEDDTEYSYHMVFFISDGEITDGKKLRSYEGLAEDIDFGAVLGYGTEEGGPMKAESYFGAEDSSYITYYDNHFNETIAMSRIDEDNLETIADQLGVSYYRMSDKRSVNKVITQLTKKVEEGDMETVTVVGFGYVETYYYFAIALILFLFYDAIFYRRKLRYKG